MSGFRAIMAFSRPHTVAGTILSVTGLYLIALADAPAASDLPVGGLLWALAACLGANLYIVGLNQFSDLDIDRINKPDLPLVSGALSLAQGWGIVWTGCIAAIAIAAWQGPYLLATVLISLAIGTAYSWPPLRLKRYHFWAAACIFTVRGVVVNLLLFLHLNRLFGQPDGIPPQVWVLTAFVFGLSVVIAWFKDIPDMEGDSRFRIATLSLRLGPGTVFALGRGLLAACYLGLIAAALVGIPGVHSGIAVVSHSLLLAVMIWLGQRTDPADRAAMSRYYLTIWGLFFSEYLVYSAACLAA